MIRARHRLWADIIFQPYLTWLFKRNFHEIQVLGTPPKIPDDLPVLLLPNHSTWWDGFFVYLLNKKIFHRTAYLMMLEKQLSKYKFFTKIGAYSIEPEKRRSIIESLEYTVQLLNQEMPLRGHAIGIIVMACRRLSPFFRKGSCCHGRRALSVTNAVLNGLYRNTGNPSLCCPWQFAPSFWVKSFRARFCCSILSIRLTQTRFKGWSGSNGLKPPC